MKPTHHFVPSVRFRKAKSTARTIFTEINPMDFNNCESILQFDIKGIPSYICPFAPSYVKSLQEHI